MTRDRGGPFEDEPQRPSWWMPSRPASPPSAPPASSHSMGNGVMAEVRERVRALETMLPLLERMAVDRFSTQAKRMDGVDGRLETGESRMDRLDDRLSETEYGLAAAIFGLVVAGRMTLEQAALLLKLLLPL